MNNRDQAFPTSIPEIPNACGLSKRELFAALAMQGLCANTKVRFDDGVNEHPDDRRLAIGQASCRIADALLEALKQQ